MGVSLFVSADLGWEGSGCNANPSLLISGGMSIVEGAVNDGDGKKVYVL